MTALPPYQGGRGKFSMNLSLNVVRCLILGPQIFFLMSFSAVQYQVGVSVVIMMQSRKSDGKSM
jgi:hypothetical protein